MKSLSRTASLALAATFAAATLGATAYAHSDGSRGSYGQERGQHAQGQHAKGEHQHARGEHKGRGEMGDRHGMADQVMTRLNLSQEQRDQMFELRHGAQPEVRAAMIEARTQREALRELGRAETFDATAAEDVSRALADAQARALLLRTQMHAEMAAVLTPEQREQMTEWRNEHAGMRGQRGRGMMP